MRQRGEHEQATALVLRTDIRARHTFGLRVYDIVATTAAGLKKYHVTNYKWLSGLTMTYTTVGSLLLNHLLAVPTRRNSVRDYNVTVTCEQGKNINSSSVFNPIFLASSDDGDLGHYSAEIITLGLLVFGTSGKLPVCFPVVGRGRSRTEGFRRRLRRCERAFNLHRK